jgi:hypothetical protein
MVNVEKKILLSKEKVLKFLENKHTLDIVCTIGAGDIDTLVHPIKEFLNSQQHAD